MTEIAKPVATSGKLIETSGEDEEITKVMRMTEEEREHLSTINDTIQEIQKEAFSRIAATRQAVSFKDTTEIFEPDSNTPVVETALPRSAPLREESDTHPSCSYTPIPLSRTPLQESYDKQLVFTEATDEPIFNGLAAQSEIGCHSRQTLCHQNPLQGLHAQLS